MAKVDLRKFELIKEDLGLSKYTNMNNIYKKSIKLKERLIEGGQLPYTIEDITFLMNMAINLKTLSLDKIFNPYLGEKGSDCYQNI